MVQLQTFISRKAIETYGEAASSRFRNAGKDADIHFETQGKRQDAASPWDGHRHYLAERQVPAQWPDSTMMSAVAKDLRYLRISVLIYVCSECGIMHLSFVRDGRFKEGEAFLWLHLFLTGSLSV
jgi:hypothetical protein